MPRKKSNLSTKPKKTTSAAEYKKAHSQDFGTYDPKNVSLQFTKSKNQPHNLQGVSAYHIDKRAGTLSYQTPAESLQGGQGRTVQLPKGAKLKKAEWK